MFFFFFSSRRRHTRLQGDWSSDVCSSDLGRGTLIGGLAAAQVELIGLQVVGGAGHELAGGICESQPHPELLDDAPRSEERRCRASVWGAGVAAECRIKDSRGWLSTVQLSV